MAQDIPSEVKRIIKEQLDVDEKDIKPESSFIDDLGADSLDFVDIVFMLDRELGIRVRETEFNFLTRLDFSSPEVMKNGFLTKDVIDKLSDWLPAMAKVKDRERVTPRELFSLITVESICIVAERRLPKPEPVA
jgi:acyl carrier protein